METTVIMQVAETKFFGVIIDQHISWKPHISFFFSKRKGKNCGDYYESRLLSIIQNVVNLILPHIL